MMSESAVQKRIRLKAAQQHGYLWRNNVGACIDQSGHPVRYGLANESKKMNKVLKSSDLIGPTPIFITPQMVGTIVGVFTAVECKHEGWTFPHPTNKAEYERCSAQLTFHNIVRRVGGYAGFATCEDDYLRIIRATSVS